MKYAKLSFAALTVLSVTSLYADNYKIIIDAGSSGSRVHLFKYDASQVVPEIKEVFSESTKPGLSSYENNPQEAGKSLKKMMDDVSQELKMRQVSSNEVEVNVLATAGMRFLSDEKQKMIYASVKNFIADNQYGFPIGQVETIPGKMEAIYGWLDVNYLATHFAANTPTIGSIDMGGASAQIAFATHDTEKSDDEISLQLNGQQYHVFAKSFLGLGQDEARNAMSRHNDAGYCYPSGYKNGTLIGDFHLENCAHLFANVIAEHDVEKQILSTEQQQFIAYSGAFYTYNFFDADKTPDQATLENKIRSVCSETWDQLHHDYPQVTEKYLATYCANAVYMDELFYHAYRLHNQQLGVVSQIAGKDLDWTLGALLYNLIK